ncbi:hypothetical protein M9H77_23259 [Catharanthus roseus]|uniref:Uncharacterized protein n=1 Tax=Catharanthus roseus TaxID=4058 RepID=A0ACC0ATI4_CATRO|nr:hypothetical protein M9H77_23259 [Catharanthus roseus]
MVTNVGPQADPWSVSWAGGLARPDGFPGQPGPVATPRIFRQSFAFTCQVLLEIDHITLSLVNIISNVARLLWLFDGTHSRTNPFKGRPDGMSCDRHEDMESFQGSITRSRTW